MAWTTTDLDQRPELISSTLPLFAAPPGQHHVVCGLPQRMGQPPVAGDLRACLGVLVLVDRIHPVAAVGLCPYSETQITVWGPAFSRECSDRLRAASQLLTVARGALREGGFTSLRVLVDTRNRSARAGILQLGFTAWKDTHIFTCALTARPETELSGLRVATALDHPAIALLLDEGFPDSDHCRPNLVQREDAGYRHYLLTVGDVPVGAGAVQRDGRRAWVKLIAVSSHARGRGFAGRLLRGIMASEQRLGATAMGLEVLADNRAAIAVYEGAGMTRAWTAAIFTGPV